MNEQVEVGGVMLPAEQVRQARAVLEVARGNHVRGPLQRAGHPLAHAPDRDWYHGISRYVLGVHPEMRFPGGTHHEPAAHVKTRVLHYLAMDCTACGW
jgi:hypothetical protein